MRPARQAPPETGREFRLSQVKSLDDTSFFLLFGKYCRFGPGMGFGLITVEVEFGVS